MNLTKIFLIVAFLCLCVLQIQCFTRSVGCQLEVDVDSMYSPILWNSQGRIFPKLDADSGKWFLEVSSGAQFHASCTRGTGNNHIHSTKENDIEVECVTGSMVKTLNGLQSFDSLLCEREQTETVFRNGTCYNGYTNIEVAFLAADNPFSLITICHNEATDETLYARSEIDGPNLHLSESINRPDFTEGGFFPEISANDCYSVAGQTATVAQLVGSTELANQYIQQTPNLFMSRGHLTPNGDPVYAYEKRATFYYINAHPQWQTINGGNWNLLEIAVRNYAGTKKRVLDVYSGTYGVSKLNDINGNPVEIWLGKTSNGQLVQRLPAPHLTWKVVHDKTANTGVAIIQVNNPYADINSETLLCENKCSQLSWVTWQVSNVRLGYTYCCDVASFSRGLSYAPNLGSLPLMDY